MVLTHTHEFISKKVLSFKFYTPYPICSLYYEPCALSIYVTNEVDEFPECWWFWLLSSSMQYAYYIDQTVIDIVKIIN